MSIDAITITPNPCNVQQSFVISCEVSPRTPTETVIVPVGHYEKPNSSGTKTYDWLNPAKAYDGNESSYGVIANNTYGGRDNIIYFHTPIPSGTDIVALRAEFLLRSKSTGSLTLDIGISYGTSATNQTAVLLPQTITMNTATAQWFSVEWEIDEMDKTYTDLMNHLSDICISVQAESPTRSGDRYMYESRLVVQAWK